MNGRDGAHAGDRRNAGESAFMSMTETEHVARRRPPNGAATELETEANGEADHAPRNDSRDEKGHASAPISDGGRDAGKRTTGVVGLESERETFIPVSRLDVFERLTAASAWAPGEAAEVRRFFKYLAAWRHQAYMERLLKLKDAYLNFSPDRDTIKLESVPASELPVLQERTIKLVVELLERANYRPITRDQLNQIFAEDSAYGLELSVDLDEFEELLIFCRGASSKTLRQRTWRKLWLGHAVREVPIYQRLLLLLKLKDEETRIGEIMRQEDVSRAKAKRTLRKLRKLRSMVPDSVSSDFIYLKLFKQIPRADLQMMFPNTRVEFRLWDKIKLGVTAGGGTIASVATTLTKVLAAVNPVSIVMAIIGLVGVIFRQVMKFFNQRNQYMMVLAQNLYFHTLADNRGVLTLLCDRAEEEDVKEEMLLYSLIAKEPLLEQDLGEAREAIETFLDEEFGVQVRFDLEDALQRLLADGVVTRGADQALYAMPPREAALHVDRMWDLYLDTAPFFDPPSGADTSGENVVTS
ncbi:MAG: DUF3754 domain-containing protein [Rhizobiales bacterium]|nr:DUF3754 domain-containing protein [Hyphomicrobiales bacterium]